MTAMDRDTFFKSLTTTIAEVGEKLAPDDDWAPAVFLAADDGLHAAALDPGFFDSGEAKDLLADAVIPQAIQTANAEHVAFVSTVWMVKATDPDIGAPPGQHPDRIEAVMLVGASRDGTVMQAIAEIERSSGPPKLKEWDDREARIGGRFITGMLGAFGHQAQTVEEIKREFAERNAE